MRSENDRPTTAEQHANDTNDGGAGGGLLNVAAGALLGLVGVGAVSETASGARGTTRRLLVLGDGAGKHTYEIELRRGGSISKAAHAGENDSVQSSRNPTADGELWHYNADSYTYTGEVDSVTCDGDLSVHFLDGAFGNDAWIEVHGESSGKHRYRIDSAAGDIDPVSYRTGSADTDDRGSASERNGTPDTVSGQVTDRNHDAHTTGANDTIKHITVTDGHLTFTG